MVQPVFEILPGHMRDVFATDNSKVTSGGHSKLDLLVVLFYLTKGETGSGRVL